MDKLVRAINLLRETEKKLRDIGSEAVMSGDYASVVHIADWARSLSELVKSVHGSNKTDANHVDKLNNKGAHGDSKPTRSVRHVADAYPQFLKQNGQLIRIAWSKREKKEYRHKVPYSVLTVLTDAILEKGKDGRVFSTDELLPIHKADDGGPVPNYQAYVGIALLKQTGLIDQHGRQGYSITRQTGFKNAVDGIWGTLPDR